VKAGDAMKCGAPVFQLKRFPPSGIFPFREDSEIRTGRTKLEK
jgi:hypothetical protein